MSIIEFKPSSWHEQQTQQTTQSLRYAYRQSDDFVDFEIKDEIKPKKSSSKKTKSLTQAQAHDKACYMQCEAIMKRNEVAQLIEKGAKRNYSDMLGTYGNLITFDFDSDPLGRCIMIEDDLKGKTARLTTFIPDTGEIIRIEEKNPNSKTYNQISFFNGEKHFEFHKEIKHTIFKSTTKEIFGFENGKPTFYKKDCTKIDNRNVPKEEYIFSNYYM